MAGSHENVETENARLRKELELLGEERDILKSNPGFWPACAR